MNEPPDTDEPARPSESRPDVPRSITRRAMIGRIVAISSGAILLVAVVILLQLKWTEPHASPLAVWLLQTQIIDGPVPLVVYTLTGLATVYLFLRRVTRRVIIVDAIGIVVGGLVALGLLWLVQANQTFGVYLGKTISLWVVGAMLIIGLALANLWKTSWLRRAGAIVAVVLAVLSATVGINAYFGLDPTLGGLAGISVQSAIRLPVAQAAPGTTSKSEPPLWSHWVAPADIGTKGKFGSVTIPNSASGFKARAAEVYLPPAALVPNAPALPLVVMMMGQPGDPDISFAGGILDSFANRHHGLAPIVLVVDQIGNPSVDTLCLNTRQHGNVETYITKDVVDWARTHLHVLQDPAHWTIAGYSNGGECAAYFGAKYPSIWGNVIDMSGEAYAGSEQPRVIASQYFHGNFSAYEATWPITILADHTYPDSWGVFTVSSDDPTFRLQVTAVSRAARAAGWRSTFFEVPNGGHGAGAVIGGLTTGYTQLYPRWGLSAPGTKG